MRPAGWVVLVAAVASGCVRAAPTRAQGQEPGAARSVAVYTLSRGKGVPPPTRETYNKARALLQDLERQKRVTRVEETRIGLEGEARLCAEFSDDRTARETTEKLHALSRDVDLLNVVEEPCRKAD